MRRVLFSLILLVAILACKPDTKEHLQIEGKSEHRIKDCPAGGDTINFVTTFRKDTSKTPTNRFFLVVSFITDKGLFKPSVNKTSGKLKIKRETSKTFPVAYDTCNMKRWIIKNFVMKNMQVTTLGFTATKKDSYAGLTPGLHFEEWKFANNSDRDSAMKIVQTAYTYPNNIVMYEKRYSQFMMDHKRIFLLETGAKFAEPYAIQYKKLVENFIAETNSNR